MGGTEIQLEDSSGVPYGAGPLMATSWTDSDRLDEAGPVSGSVPITDANSELLTVDPPYTPYKQTMRARAPFHPNLSVTDAGAGVIDRIEKDAAKRNFVLGGNNLLVDLARYSVGGLVLSNGSTGPMAGADVLDAVMVFAPDWTYSGAVVADIRYQANGESVLELLKKVADLSGEHFRLEYDGDGNVLRSVEWLSTPDDSGLRAEDGGDALEMSADVCLIAQGSVKLVASSADLYTRYTNPRGGGNEAAALSILWTTRNGAPGDGTGGDYIADGILIHIEDSLGSEEANAQGCYIEHIAAAALYGTYERQFTASDIAFKTSGTLHAVSNQLVDAAIVSLNRAAVIKNDYQIGLLALRQRIRPGATFVANYHGLVTVETAGGVAVMRWLDLDNKTLLLLSVDGSYDKAGVRTTKVTVTDPESDYWPVTGDRALAKVVQVTRAMQAHLQTAANSLAADSAGSAPASNIHAASFTMAAAASKVVSDAAVVSFSGIFLTPTNAAAGTLQGGVKSLYVDASTITTGAFTVKTANGAAAAGTETYLYVVVN